MNWLKSKRTNCSEALPVNFLHVNIFTLARNSTAWQDSKVLINGSPISRTIHGTCHNEFHCLMKWICQMSKIPKTIRAVMYCGKLHSTGNVICENMEMLVWVNKCRNSSNVYARHLPTVWNSVSLNMLNALTHSTQTNVLMTHKY